MISFFVVGIPKPQPRTKAGTFGGHARVYTPDTANTWKDLVILEAKKYLPNPPLYGPTRVDIGYHMPRPKSHYVSGKKEKGLKKTAPYWHTNKPDTDNLTKLIYDVLSSINFWEDDKLVCHTTQYKIYSEEPGVDVRISDNNIMEPLECRCRRREFTTGMNTLSS